MTVNRQKSTFISSKAASSSIPPKSRTTLNHTSLTRAPLRAESSAKSQVPRSSDNSSLVVTSARIVSLGMPGFFLGCHCAFAWITYRYHHHDHRQKLKRQHVVFQPSLPVEHMHKLMESYQVQILPNWRKTDGRISNYEFLINDWFSLISSAH